MCIRDSFQTGLGRFGQQRQLLATGIGEPAKNQRLTVLFPDAVAILIDPAVFGEQFFGPFRVIFLGCYFSAELWKIRL